MNGGADEIRAKIAEHCDVDIDYYPARNFSEARPCHGREELWQFLEAYLGAWHRALWESRELIAVGDDRVLASVRLRGEGRGSGVKLEGHLYQCHWLRHGKL